MSMLQNRRRVAGFSYVYTFTNFGACPYKKYVSAQAYNKKLLSNILPVHVAEFFMSGDKNNDVST
jgi:hypothetical protein